MSTIYKVVAGIGLLIGLFLVLANRQATSEIIATLGTQGISGIKTLQGR